MPRGYEAEPTRTHLSKWAVETMSTPNMPSRSVPLIVRDFEPAYNTESRVHHNISHLNFMLKTIEQWKKHFSDPSIALWATIGHDCFMEFGRDVAYGQNEARSALYTEARLEGLVESEKLEEIKLYIGATASHTLLPSSELPSGNAVDLAMFLDADNGCVGADPIVYRDYKEGVRQEYLNAGVSLDEYNAGRLSFLQEYNSRSQLYLSMPGVTRFEVQAHINMTKEITELTGEMI